jgi:hypothetical protein
VDAVGEGRRSEDDDPPSTELRQSAAAQQALPSFRAYGRFGRSGGASHREGADDDERC